MVQPSIRLAAQMKVTDAVIWVSTWVAGGTGLILLVAAALTLRLDLLAFGAVASLVGIIGWIQKRRAEPHPLLLLMVASTGCALVAPIADRSAHLSVLPAMTLFVGVGVISLKRATALRFAFYCGALVIFMVPWLLPGMSGAEWALAGLYLLAVGVAAWRFITLAGDVMVQEEESHRLLFQSSPVAILEEDFGRVAAALDDLRRSGVVDLERHLSENPDETRRLISEIRIRRANPSALEMIGVSSLAELVDVFSKVRRADIELESFVCQFVAIWEGKREIALDLAGLRMDGQSVEAVLHWSATPRGGDLDLERVIVTISDITPRKVIENQLAEALESNRRLLDFEHAIAASARALLLGNGDGALQIALEILRSAIGADRAFLTINVEDDDEGDAFRIVNSVSTPEYTQDDWVGRVIPWTRYDVAHPALSSGKPYQHLATDKVGEGWNRSVLAVPIFNDESWIGTVGFIDIARRTLWTDDAVRMLEVAAPILGTFWERELSRSRLEELVESKDRFVASVSHELRTPLAAVLGFAEAIRDNAASFKSDELTDMLELIADQSQEMANMVEDLLVSARADIGTISIRPQYVYLRSQAEAVLAGIGPVDGHEIRVVGGPGKVWADPSRTRQILRNLLTNAIRYGGDTVEVEAVTHGDTAVLTVTDNGPALAESEWARIFEPYQRAHDTPTQTASIGLGLTVSRQLARLMGGDLAYQAAESGSAFKLILPVEPPGARADSNEEVVASPTD